MTEPLSTERCSHCEQLGNLAWSLQQLAEGGERNECVKITLGRWEAAHLLSLLVAPSGAPGWKLEDVTRWHDLKTWPEFFRAVRENRKPFEVRLNDRDFQEGDGLRLHEWDPATEAYTGEIEVRRVSYMLTDLSMGVREGYAILGLHSFAAPPVPLEKALDREQIAPIIHRCVLNCSEVEAYAAADTIIDQILKLIAERDGVVAPTSGWRDIVSCPTDMADEVELKLPDGSTCIGMFSWPSGQWRRWVGEVPSARVEGAVMRVFSPLPKDVYPTHWRPKSTPFSERLSSDRAGGGCEGSSVAPSRVLSDSEQMTASAWRPIETAPKVDRKRILVIQDTPGDFEGVFTGAHWIEFSGAPGRGYWQADLGGLWPTRWMPAPDSSSEGHPTEEGRRASSETLAEPDEAAQ